MIIWERYSLGKQQGKWCVAVDCVRLDTNTRAPVHAGPTLYLLLRETTLFKPESIILVCGGSAHARKAILIRGRSSLPHELINQWTDTDILRDFFSRQDNNPRRAASIKRGDVFLGPLHCRSPNLNPIEHVWDEIDFHIEADGIVSDRGLESNSSNFLITK